MNNTASEDTLFISNHWAMFGAESLVIKVGRKWALSERFANPMKFARKADAVAWVTAYVLTAARSA